MAGETERRGRDGDVAMAMANATQMRYDDVEWWDGGVNKGVRAAATRSVFSGARTQGRFCDSTVSNRKI